MLITFEGPEGAGKSTAIVAIAEKLRGTGCDVLTTREPGSGDFGERIRTLLLEGPDVEKKVELMLFLADRANHVQTVIKPAIDQGKVVLCDRYTDSTIAYQGYAQGLDIEFLRRANRRPSARLRDPLRHHPRSRPRSTWLYGSHGQPSSRVSPARSPRLPPRSSCRAKKMARTRRFSP